MAKVLDISPSSGFGLIHEPDFPVLKIGSQMIVPNEIFLLGLSPGTLAVYSYLLCCENRKTYQCWPSYKTIGRAVRMSQNTVRKYVCELEDQQREHNSHYQRRSEAQRQPALHQPPDLVGPQPVLQFYEQQLAQMDVAAERQRATRALAFRSEMRLSVTVCAPLCAGLLRDSIEAPAREQSPVSRLYRQRPTEAEN